MKQKVAIYVPMKDDEVDKKLADFVNNYPDRNKLKIMFMRESEGVYSFGSKKILIKIKNNQIKSKCKLIVTLNPLFLVCSSRGRWLSVN